MTLPDKLRQMASEQSNAFLEVADRLTELERRVEESERRREQKELLSPEDVAAQLGIGKWGIYAALDSGELEGAKLRGKWRITQDAVDEWFERNLNRPKRHGHLRPV